jgi:hypothetical protein
MNVDEQRQTVKYLFNRHLVRVHFINEGSRSGRQKTYLSTRDKVYRLIDEMVEDKRTQGELLESVGRWWDSIPISERKIVRRNLLDVVAKSNATIETLWGAVTELD